MALCNPVQSSQGCPEAILIAFVDLELLQDRLGMLAKRNLAVAECFHLLNSFICKNFFDEGSYQRSQCLSGKDPFARGNTRIHAPEEFEPTPLFTVLVQAFVEILHQQLQQAEFE